MADAGPEKAKVKGREKRAKVQFKLVQQSYEDKDYDGVPKPVLVPAAVADQRYKKRRKNAAHPMFVFGEDLPDDFTNRRNMLMTDDTRPGEEHMFDDEVEEEFDESFIHELMYGDVDEEDEDMFKDDEGEEAAEYPQHDVTSRAIDKQFTKMMREFDVDEDINDADVDDPRTHGPLEVDQYMTALEEFVEDNAGYIRETAEPAKNKGLINQLKMMAHRNRIFDSNGEGVFVTTLLPDKTGRFMREYKEQTDEIHRLAKEKYEESLRRRAAGLEPEAAPQEESESSDEEEVEVVEVARRDRMDCETILSTYSTLYNHPNVIAAARKKINPTAALANERRRRMEEREEATRGGAAASAGSEEEDSDDDDDSSANRLHPAALGIDLTVRPENETAEEKKLRRQLVKQMQRERRTEKKALKSAYKDVTVMQNEIRPMSKQSKAQVSLSLGGVISATGTRKSKK